MCRVLPCNPRPIGGADLYLTKKKIHLIEIHWGEPISLVSPNGDEQRFSTFEKAGYWLRQKWPVADDASRRALLQVEAAMDCLIPASTARATFVAAARSAGFKVAGMSGAAGCQAESGPRRHRHERPARHHDAT